MNSRIELSEKRPNKDRKFGSARFYYPATLTKDGDAVCSLLFTEGDIRRAAKRAVRNPEDFEQVGIIEWVKEMLRW